MCKMKSAIILKDRIFIPDYDGHSDMLKELGIEDTEKNAAMLFVRAELSPKNGDVFTPIDEWIFEVDQDIKPDWFVESYEKERMIQAVKEWAKNRIHIGIDGLEINSGANHYIKDCKNVEIYGSASISRVYGSATISYVYGSASISRVYGSASISYVYGNASISDVYDSASISYVYGSASISDVYGSATISRVYDSASISYVYGNASISYVYDSATISRVYDSASISYVYGSASISDVYDSATISYVYGSASISEVKGKAVVANSPYSKWQKQSDLILSENATFKDNIGKVIYQSGDYKLVSVNGGTALKARAEQ